MAVVRDYVEFSDYMVCQRPKDLQEFPIKELEAEDYGCRSKTAGEKNKINECDHGILFVCRYDQVWLDSLGPVDIHADGSLLSVLLRCLPMLRGQEKERRHSAR